MLIENYHVFLDACTVAPGFLLSDDPDVRALFQAMGRQRKKIWDLCEMIDHIKSSVRREMREMFPENIPTYGVDSYTTQTEHEHPLNNRLFRTLDNITHTSWRKGPNKEKPHIELPIMLTTRNKFFSQFVIIKKTKLTFRVREIRRLTSFAASNESDFNDKNYEMISKEKDSSSDEIDEKKQKDVKKEVIGEIKEI